MDGSQNKDWLKSNTLQGSRHVMGLSVKIAYAIFLKKPLLNYSAVKDSLIYHISSLISVHSNCTDSIYADYGGFSGMIAEKVSWIQFPAKISAV